MISTVTVNPAVDYTLQADEVGLGDVNRVDFLAKAAAGKGINVAKAVSNLDEEVTALACVGGFTGRYIEKELKEMDIVTDFKWVENETRINFKVVDNSNNETKINQRGLALQEDEVDSIFNKAITEGANADLLVLGGSLPTNVADDFYQKLIRKLEAEDTKVFLDTSETPLRLALQANPTLIKPNVRELEEIRGKELSFSELISVSQELVASGIEIVVVSRGAKGALLVTEEGVWQATPPQVEVKSTVGAGDSMVGALAVAYLGGNSASDMIQSAVAMSVATILLPGSKVGDVTGIKKWIDKVEVKKLEG
ncbi:MAG: 1-phosphofructokinase [Bacillota bacterium]